jgi:hypothetical protein
MIVWLQRISSDLTSFVFPKENEQLAFEGIKDQFHLIESMGFKWQSPIMCRLEPKIHPDFFEIPDSDIIAVSERVYGALMKLKCDNLEFLPIGTDSGRYYAIHIVKTLDCLDHAISEYTAIADGQIINYKYLDFLPGRIPNNIAFFKIPEMPYTTFVTDTLQDLCDDNGFIGLEFDPGHNLVWDDFDN